MSAPALALVERGEVDLGIVYASDAIASPQLLMLPLDLPDPAAIRYPVAVLRASRHGDSRGIRRLSFLTPRTSYLPAPRLCPIAMTGWLSPAEWAIVGLSLKVSLVAVLCTLPVAYGLAWLIARRRFSRAHGA